MNNIVPQIYGYHCNDKERVNDFISGKLDSIESEDDGIWLGNGMYFWDNLSNAEYWKSEKERKKKGGIQDGDFLIVQSMIRISKLLDLTDEQSCESMEKLIEIMCEKGFKLNLDSATLGQKINFLFETPLFDDIYEVIKVHGEYPRKKISKFINYQQNNNTQPTHKIKTIYKVYNNNSILSKSLITD